MPQRRLSCAVERRRFPAGANPVRYRSSLTEIVQIIGRATRDAPGKTRTRFTNLIAEPDASEEAVTEAVNDTLKAIAASLLMEQVLAPHFNFVAKTADSEPDEELDYGEGGYDPNGCNAGVDEKTGRITVEIKGLVEPKSARSVRICQEDLGEVVAAFLQDRAAAERGLFDTEATPQELTQGRMGKILKEKYPELDENDVEAVRERAIAAMNLQQEAKWALTEGREDGRDPEEGVRNTALVDGVRRFMDVQDLDVDLIDRINPFGAAYAILAKAMTADSLAQVQAAITAKRVWIDPDEARELAGFALTFKRQHGRLPKIGAVDPWEDRLAQGVAVLARMAREAGRAQEE